MEEIKSRILKLILLIIFSTALITIFLNFLGIHGSFTRIIYVSIILLSGYFLSNSIGNYFRKVNENLSNAIKLIGYLITTLIAISLFQEIQGTLLATSVFGGLIVGLALQPVLSNFFAGLLIMFTGYVQVGKKVRVLSTQIPYTLTVLPSYKFFSVESSDLGYKGVIEEVGWFFSTLKSEEGKIIKIPNNVLISSSILEETEDNEFVYSLRVEFPLKLKRGYNLEKIEKKINEILKNYIVVKGPYFNEQSDKDYVFIRMKIKSKIKDWEMEKSELLKKLLELKRKIEKKT